MLSKTPFDVPAPLMARSQNLAPATMAVAGADHGVALESARQATDAGLITPVLVGDTATIKAMALDMDWDISGLRLEQASGESDAAERAVALARGGEVASLMKGQIHTDALMRAVVSRDTGLRTDRRLSHIFHMTVPGSDRVLYITDAAINVAPDADAQIHIINNAVQMAHALGCDDPKVAMLSATESVMDSMPSSKLADAVVRRAQAGEVTGAIVDGPFAFDNAMSPEAAALKGVDSPVAGNADILVVPNIEMGNGLFKMMVYFMSGLAAGVVMGASVPIVLTSRADPPEARLAATAIASIISKK
ncbi:MAG: bifunctional enoyl-CoA hydratase/phosphate acetyltransferase [Rhodospirillales bacterium]|nr:bifunctional enoyl-CoA hydratase/phosphate acetyltransferase [Rhodospirillales bacterium]MBT4040982.1 bifunctional enoyl-CoA hydratase/phosphate acetyltransferase [Rhodospirillales bacterium]MBT4625616.1 bifunctional enoyl-CoA hydratase/phosphate acetyltransferase [Rhodospirillales bacterium]MBT5350215.1 bifunctional enoyl-CoA hydratase/phosphate acetyltransferase [Rhodospirillales bacterium]MBT5521683.1 bifunctional enoyl-CoA hydratase/phosphate acetyltransferase [Rhodospirillales bacterium